MIEGDIILDRKNKEILINGKKYKVKRFPSCGNFPMFEIEDEKGNKFFVFAEPRMIRLVN